MNIFNGTKLFGVAITFVHQVCHCQHKITFPFTNTPFKCMFLSSLLVFRRFHKPSSIGKIFFNLKNKVIL